MAKRAKKLTAGASKRFIEDMKAVMRKWGMGCAVREEQGKKVYFFSGWAGHVELEELLHEREF